MTDREQPEHLKQHADATLAELMQLLDRSPLLVEELKPLLISDDPVQEFTILMRDKPVEAEQILRLSLATLVNYHTSAAAIGSASDTASTLSEYRSSASGHRVVGRSRCQIRMARVPRANVTKLDCQR